MKWGPGVYPRKTLNSVLPSYDENGQNLHRDTSELSDGVEAVCVEVIQPVFFMRKQATRILCKSWRISRCRIATGIIANCAPPKSLSGDGFLRFPPPQPRFLGSDRPEYQPARPLVEFWHLRMRVLCSRHPAFWPTEAPIRGIQRQPAVPKPGNSSGGCELDEISFIFQPWLTPMSRYAWYGLPTGPGRSRGSITDRGRSSRWGCPSGQLGSCARQNPSRASNWSANTGHSRISPHNVRDCRFIRLNRASQVRHLATATYANVGCTRGRSPLVAAKGPAANRTRHRSHFQGPPDPRVSASATWRRSSLWHGSEDHPEPGRCNACSSRATRRLGA